MALPLTVSTITKNTDTISVYKGETKDIQITIIQDGIVEETGKPGEIPVPLDGAMVYFSVKDRVSNPRSLIYKTSADPTEITIEQPPKNGVVTIHLLAEDTINLEADTLVFDVWVRLSNGKQYPVIEVSEFALTQPVTLVK